MSSLNSIFAKIDPAFNRGPNRSGYFTPADCQQLVSERLAVYMGPNTQKWVEESLASGKMNPRWTTLHLTPSGEKREPTQHQGKK